MSLEDIRLERDKQIFKGFGAKHDDQYKGKELLLAAKSYLHYMTADFAHIETRPPYMWPWDEKYWHYEDYYSNLKKIGALIVAEMERYNREENK